MFDVCLPGSSGVAVGGLAWSCDVGAPQAIEHSAGVSSVLMEGLCEGHFPCGIGWGLLFVLFIRN